ncbi:hypothetical protein [Paraburkholderia terrae]|uniref:hypothetical protein n=1 Tax=Paraburkholderia terrae TaxID=311230 RepID=UPI001EE317F1|nr:hypothetical protein [Paraburkholderia terrae]GJH00253.1 hypothetical protein CBA19C8_06870 [Paraburkholderia terrae]
MNEILRSRTGRRVPARGPRTAKKPRKQHEFLEQSALFTWARTPCVLAQYPQLDILSCSLNGVKLSTAQAGKARAAGMLSGEHDVKLPVARAQYIGLSIEMKAGDGAPTENQLWYGTRLEQEGWCVRYCWTWTEARDEIVRYLSMPDGRVL